MNRTIRRAGGLLAAATAIALASTASAAVVQSGLYVLHNHPDGAERPPLYGMRLDELYNETGGHDVFTFDFDHALSSMMLTYDSGAGTIAISGVAHGGRDVGGSYAADQYLGLYTISFSYTVGVAPVPGDDDVWVDAATHTNSGTIATPLGDVIDLVDERMGGYSFRLGDEDNDAGHRGYAGMSGWGWMTHHPTTMGHVASSDFLFTAEFLVPTPGTIVLGGLGAGLMAFRRRRD